jgi:hypothetical protein
MGAVDAGDVSNRRCRVEALLLRPGNRQSEPSPRRHALPGYRTSEMIATTQEECSTS